MGSEMMGYDYEDECPNPCFGEPIDKDEQFKALLFEEINRSHFFVSGAETGNFQNLPVKGANARVAKWDYEGERHLIKYSNQQKEKEKLRKELDITEQFNSSTIMKSRLYEDEDNGNAALVMRYMEEGSLTKFLKEKADFLKTDQSCLKVLLKDILEGICLLHERNIVHCDIKCENIVIEKDQTGQYRAVLIDFGESVTTQSTFSCPRGIGTFIYMSPEAVRGKAGAPSDIWSFGLTICAIGWGMFPEPGVFPNPWQNSGFSTVTHELALPLGFGKALPKIPTFFSSELQEFVSSCLLKAEERPTASDLLERLQGFQEPLLNLVVEVEKVEEVEEVENDHHDEFFGYDDA